MEPLLSGTSQRLREGTVMSWVPKRAPWHQRFGDVQNTLSLEADLNVLLSWKRTHTVLRGPTADQFGPTGPATLEINGRSSGFRGVEAFLFPPTLPMLALKMTMAERCDQSLAGNPWLGENDTTVLSNFNVEYKHPQSAKMSKCRWPSSSSGNKLPELRSSGSTDDWYSWPRNLDHARLMGMTNHSGLPGPVLGLAQNILHPRKTSSS